MNFTEAQQLAIDSWQKPTAILAGAGSGKTEVLTRRLLRILQEEKLGLHQILAITFTEKSGQELKNRIAPKLSQEQKMGLPFAAIGTFHRFCFSLLKEHAPDLGLSDAISIWDEHSAGLAIHRHAKEVLLQSLQDRRLQALKLVEAMEFRQTLGMLEEILKFRWHFEKAKNSDADEELFEATHFLYQKVLESYTKEKERRQVLDFQDLELLTLKLLEQNPGILKNLQERYLHILVDEAQDINDLQRALLEKLFSPQKNCICIVGDNQQSIYRFRGANVQGFRRLVESIRKSGGILVALNENFRSRPTLINFVNKTFQNIFPPDNYRPLVITRSPHEDEGVEILSIETEKGTPKEEGRKQEAAALADFVFKIVEGEKYRFGNVALLFQSLRDSHYYEKAFRSRGIPFRIFGGRGFLSAQEVHDLMFVLKLMVNPEDRLSLVGLMRSPLMGLSDSDIVWICRENPSSLGKIFLEREEAKWLGEIFTNREIWSSTQILDHAITQTQYDVLAAQLDPSGMKLANIEQFVELVRGLECEEEMDLEMLIDYFESLKKQKTPMAPPPASESGIDCCQMMTVHASKGLQFPVVILADTLRGEPHRLEKYLFVKEGEFGFSQEGELKEKEGILDREERKRLLYVAMTRAEEKLVVPIHKEATRAGLWHGWLKEALEESTPASRSSLVSRASVAPGLCTPEIRPLCRGEDNQQSEAQQAIWGALHKKESRRAPFTVTQLKQTRNVTTAANEPGTSDFKGAQLGTLVHAVLKEFAAAPRMEIPILLRKKTIELEMKMAATDFQQTQKLIENFLASAIAPPQWNGLHEFPFRLKRGNNVITGIIDYCLETDQGWVLYDFKTDAQFHPEKYKLQMDIYALALSKDPSKKVLETRLLFLKPLQIFAEPCSPERLARTEKTLAERIESV